MKTAQHLFADLTALLEDMHGVAVEGQSRSATPEMRLIFVRLLRTGILDAASRIAEIGRRLDLAP